MTSSARSSRLPISTVNFHVWQPCNMHCHFCFATFRDVRSDVLPAGHLERSEARMVIAALGRYGFEKITFAGGEPLLCPWLPDLLREAKAHGMATSIVTNGSLLDEEYLARTHTDLDWLALSIDSVDPTVLRLTGRQTRGRPLSEVDYLHLCATAASLGIAIKINTVVTAANWHEDLTGFLADARPHRWKAMRVLPMADQNSGAVEAFLISSEQFWTYVDRHRALRCLGIDIVAEDNNDMLGTYVMVDPAGRFVDNLDGRYRYSAPILQVGAEKALGQIRLDRSGFLRRGGEYQWVR
ncbi:viperin family antiviral radical SAM protein [Cryptosporangium phraense]|uniref:S-adenosylmethionine-dependent nucleotide dehydratase n=1 Tax=Cryptosporangium phraense TaxID=2593070 RepID=A0A545AEV2_9ACTN|nr:viperin family antiviral radical SAM protein [Cryptosporangium phraense]TQS39843.1 radical SAM protein [Cryptosporangium phraense]